MHYADDTFALYEDLFKEAHTVLVKEGRVGRVRQALSRWLNPQTEQALTAAAERAATGEAALGRAAQEAEQAAFDRAMLLRKQEQLAKEVEALGHSPDAYSKAIAGRETAEQAAQRARTGRNIALGAGAAGLGVGLPVAHIAGQRRGTADKTRMRNVAFGAGAAAGLAAPTLVKGLGHIARGAAQSGAFPELSGAGYGY
jgi:hypothetical protein